MDLIIRGGLDRMKDFREERDQASDARAAVTDALAQARAQRRGERSDG